MQLTRGASGFTLVELAVVLLVVALLLGSVLVPLATQARQRNISDTQRVLDETREALIGFAMATGRLPRPAVSVTNGSERASCATEAECTGHIPWTALGTSKTDAFGKMIRYSVSRDYANGSFTLSTVANRAIQTRDAAGTAVALTTPIASCSVATPCTPAVIFSLGANNYGVTTDGATVADGSASNTDEDANATNDGTTAFMYRQASENTGTAGGEFDDQVVWIPPGVLFNRMVQAGRLPQ